MQIFMLAYNEEGPPCENAHSWNFVYSRGTVAEKSAEDDDWGQKMLYSC